MPFFVAMILAVATSANAASISAAYPDDTIKVLWWALGILGSIVTTMWGGVGIWMILRILKHDVEIAAIKAHCDAVKERSGEDQC